MREYRAAPLVARLAAGLVACLTLWPGGAAAAGASPLGVVVTRERIQLPFRAAVHADGLAGMVRIRAATAVPKAGREASLSTLCPRMRWVDTKTVELYCTARGVTATAKTRDGKTTVGLALMRGIAFRAGDTGFPLVAWRDARAPLCPGESAVERGECAIGRGAMLDASAAFAQGIDGDAAVRPHAVVRLGDLALAAGDVTTALGFWDLAGATGPFARTAAARICAVMGTCTDRTQGFSFDPLDPGGLPPALRAEVARMHALTAATSGDLEGALRVLLGAPEQKLPRACDDAPAFCHRVLTEELRSRVNGPRLDKETARTRAALALALALQLDEIQPHGRSFEEAQLLAEDARTLGAPLFAARLLSAGLGDAPRRTHLDGLARVVELYLDANDRAHAETVALFAQRRFPECETAPRWRAIRAALGQPPAPAAPAAPKPTPRATAQPPPQAAPQAAPGAAGRPQAKSKTQGAAP